MLIRLVVCGLMGAGRLAELAWSRRNIEAAGSTHEGPWSRRTYPGIVALHTTVIACTAFRGGKPRRAWLLALLAVQPVRLWVVNALGERWNTRAAVPVEMEVVTTGPYAFVRHPNYTVVGVELAALPLAFGLPAVAILASLANVALLAPRISEEEASLSSLPGWQEHFHDKPRFIPNLFR